MTDESLRNPLAIAARIAREDGRVGVAATIEQAADRLSSLEEEKRVLREAAEFARSIINPHFNAVHKRAVEKLDAALSAGDATRG